MLHSYGMSEPWSPSKLLRKPWHRPLESFDALKKDLASTFVLSPPNYSREFLLYVTAYQETVGMVLVQEDDELQEHVVYYINRKLIDVELKYSHVEKLALTTVHAVQWLRHYILLLQTTLVAHINPFQFVITRRMIGGKYNKWIIILEEFDLELVSTKSNKSLVFARLVSDLPSLDEDEIQKYFFVDKHIFLILIVDLWYSDMNIFIQTLKVPPNLSRDEHRFLRHAAKN